MRVNSGVVINVFFDILYFEGFCCRLSHIGRGKKDSEKCQLLDRLVNLVGRKRQAEEVA